MTEEMLKTIIKSLVDNPDDVDIKKMEGEKTVILEVKVHADDVGKVVGKRGRTINAIRTLLKAAVTKDNKKVMVEVVQ